jgi:RNA polymerase sigma-70 factor (ECF subfamily)
VRGDGELLAAWRDGDQGAGEQLFDRYQDPITRFFANKVAGDPADLIQDTFMSCLQGRDRIAYNKLRMFYRSRRVSAGRMDFGSVSAADLAPGPGTMVAQSAEQRLLLEGLRRIPIEHQVVLELFYWESMTSAAIADVLGEPHGTIRTRLRRARQLLEQALAEAEAEPAVLRATISDLDGWAAKLREVHEP